MEKSKNPILETTVDSVRMFKVIKDSLQVMSGEDQRVEVNKMHGGMAHQGGSSKKTGKHKAGKEDLGVIYM